MRVFALDVDREGKESQIVGSGPNMLDVFRVGTQ